MGSPLSPVFANIFLGFHESKWLNDYNLNKPYILFKICWLHSSCFGQWTRFIKFFKFFYNRHPNRHHNSCFKFTIEKKINRSIAFLDVFISCINSQNLKLQKYHKSTYARLFKNFKSFMLFKCKIGFIKCVIDRSYSIKSLKSTLIIRFLVTKIS